MKSKLYTVALTGMVAISSLMSAAAFASDGTITITGVITGSSCTVKGSGANGDVAVVLDKVSTKSLTKDGETAGFKPFSINLSGCPAAVTGAIKANFDVGSLNVDQTSGRLKLTGAAAEIANNVQLQLRNGDDHSVIKVGDDATIHGATIAAAGATGAAGVATLNYMVGYYATGAATAGKANSAVTYSIIYP